MQCERKWPVQQSCHAAVDEVHNSCAGGVCVVGISLLSLFRRIIPPRLPLRCHLPKATRASEIQSRRDGREPLEPNRAVNITIPHRPSSASFLRNRLYVLVAMTLLSPEVLFAEHRVRAKCAVLVFRGSTKRALVPGVGKYPNIVYERRSTFRPWVSCLFLFQLSFPDPGVGQGRARQR